MSNKMDKLSEYKMDKLSEFKAPSWCQDESNITNIYFFGGGDFTRFTGKINPEKKTQN